MIRTDTIDRRAALVRPHGSGRRAHRLGPCALLVNHTILDALGLAALAWASVGAVAWTVIAAVH